MKRHNSKEREIRFICSGKCFYSVFAGYIKCRTGAHESKWHENYIKRKLTGKLNIRYY